MRDVWRRRRKKTLKKKNVAADEKCWETNTPSGCTTRGSSQWRVCSTLLISFQRFLSQLQPAAHTFHFYIILWFPKKVPDGAMREVQFFSHLTPQTLKSQKGARARARGPIRQARKSQRGPPEGKSVASDFLLWPPASILLIFPVQRLRGFIWELISLSWPYTFFFFLGGAQDAARTHKEARIEAILTIMHHQLLLLELFFHLGAGVEKQASLTTAFSRGNLG